MLMTRMTPRTDGHRDGIGMPLEAALFIWRGLVRTYHPVVEELIRSLSSLETTAEESQGHDSNDNDNNDHDNDNDNDNDHNNSSNNINKNFKPSCEIWRELFIQRERTVNTILTRGLPGEDSARFSLQHPGRRSSKNIASLHSYSFRVELSIDSHSPDTEGHAATTTTRRAIHTASRMVVDRVSLARFFPGVTLDFCGHQHRSSVNQTPDTEIITAIKVSVVRSCDGAVAALYSGRVEEAWSPDESWHSHLFEICHGENFEEFACNLWFMRFCPDGRRHGLPHCLPFVSPCHAVLENNGSFELRLVLGWRRMDGDELRIMSRREVLTFLQEGLTYEKRSIGESTLAVVERSVSPPVADVPTGEYSPRPLGYYSFVVDIFHFEPGSSNSPPRPTVMSYFVQSGQLTDDDELELKIDDHAGITPSWQQTSVVLHIVDRSNGKQAMLFDGYWKTHLYTGQPTISSYDSINIFERFRASQFFFAKTEEQGLSTCLPQAQLDVISDGDSLMLDLRLYWKHDISDGPGQHYSLSRLNKWDMLIFFDKCLVYR